MESAMLSLCEVHCKHTTSLWLRQQYDNITTTITMKMMKYHSVVCWFIGQLVNCNDNGDVSLPAKYLMPIKPHNGINV